MQQCSRTDTGPVNKKSMYCAETEIEKQNYIIPDYTRVMGLILSVCSFEGVQVRE